MLENGLTTNTPKAVSAVNKVLDFNSFLRVHFFVIKTTFTTETSIKIGEKALESWKNIAKKYILANGPPTNDRDGGKCTMVQGS